MNRRWYDKDPTLSMAVSLLQNAPRKHQEMTAKMVLAYMKEANLYEAANVSQDKTLFFFPLLKRMQLDNSAWEMLEIMKRLPHGKQIEVALMIIHHIYLFDSGYEQDEHWFDDPGDSYEAERQQQLS